MKRTIDANFRLSHESLERLRRLDELPDNQIRTDLIPELPKEARKQAVKNPWAKLLRDQTRKAS